MGEIGETRSILGTCIRQWMAGAGEWICAKFTQKTCLVLCSDELECQGQKPKVNIITDKDTLFIHNTPTVLTKWNGLIVHNVMQAAVCPSDGSYYCEVLLL